MVSLRSIALASALGALPFGAHGLAEEAKSTKPATSAKTAEPAKDSAATKAAGGAVNAADFKKGRDLYATRGCPTCHGSEAQWKTAGYKVTFPNTKALVGTSAAVKADAIKELDDPGYIEHFVLAVLKEGKNLSPDEDKIYKMGNRNPQGINLMLSMIKGAFARSSEEQKKEDIKSISDYIRAFRKSPEAFK